MTRSGAKELEDDPEVQAEPVRSLDGAQVRRGGGNPAAQRLCVAEQDVARRRLGFAGAVVDGRWGAGEGQGAFKKGRPASACGLRAERSRASGPRGVERVEEGLAGRWAGCEAESLAGRAGRSAERARVGRGGSGRGRSGLLH